MPLHATERRTVRTISALSLLAGLALAALPRALQVAAQPRELQGLSGVARLAGDQLGLVGDEDNGMYMRYRFAAPAAAGAVRVVPLEPARAEWIALPQGAEARDLESIEVLRDGRVVVLSERLCRLVAADGRIVAQYDEGMKETGERGLEGLAVRPLDGRRSRVAVVWEGGYPEQEKVFGLLPPGERWKDTAALSRVLVHDVEAGATDMDVASYGARVLQVPRPDDSVGPESQRFRVPDLVWHRLGAGSGGTRWGFIALLSSQNAPRSGGKIRYDHHWLQRFDELGRVVGAPFDLDAVTPAPFTGANWEGLDWWVDGRSLVLVNDALPRDPSGVLLVEIPASWRAR